MAPRTVEKTLSDFDDQFKIFNHLKAVMEEDGSSSTGEVFYKFKGAWTDEMIGQKFGYTGHQIRRFRQGRNMNLNPKKYATDNLTKWHREREEALAKVQALDENQAKLDAEVTALKIENGRLQAEIKAVRDDIKRLTAVQNEHAKSITDIEEAITKSPKWGKLGDLKGVQVGTNR